MPMKIDFSTQCQSADWIELDQGGVQWLASVNTVTNLRVL
jgi:hypothetical protein